MASWFDSAFRQKSTARAAAPADSVVQRQAAAGADFPPFDPGTSRAGNVRLRDLLRRPVASPNGTGRNNRRVAVPVDPVVASSVRESDRTASSYDVEKFREFHLITANAASTEIERDLVNFIGKQFPRNNTSDGKYYSEQDALAPMQEAFKNIDVKIKDNSAESEINFIVALLMSVTGIYKVEDLPESAKTLHNELKIDVHVLEARDILTRINDITRPTTVPQDNSDFLGAPTSRANVLHNDWQAEEVVKMIAERYGVWLDVKILRAAPIVPTITTQDPRTKFENFQTTPSMLGREGDVLQDQSTKKTKITLHLADGKFHPLVKDDFEFIPALSPESRMKWKSLSGRIGNKWANFKCPSRKEYVNLTNYEVKKRYNALGKYRTPEETALEKEFFKRQSLTSCGSGNYSLLYNFKDRIIPTNNRLKTPEIESQTGFDPRFSNLSLHGLRDKEVELEGKLNGYIKTDLDRAKAVATYRASIPEAPGKLEPKFVVTEAQIRAFSSGISKALASLEMIEVSNRNFFPQDEALETRCKRVRECLNDAKLAYEQALIQGDPGKLMCALTGCRDALEHCHGDLVQIGGNLNTINNAANEPPNQATTEELLKENYSRCFSISGFPEKLVAGFVYANDRKEALTNDLGDANDFLDSFAADNHIFLGISDEAFQGISDFEDPADRTKRLELIEQKLTDKRTAATQNLGDATTAYNNAHAHHVEVLGDLVGRGSNAATDALNAVNAASQAVAVAQKLETLEAELVVVKIKHEATIIYHDIVKNMKLIEDEFNIRGGNDLTVATLTRLKSEQSKEDLGNRFKLLNQLTASIQRDLHSR